MSQRAQIGILLYGAGGQSRDASQEDKYRLLVAGLNEAGYSVRTLSYHASRAAAVRAEAQNCAAVLGWINPIEPGLDRTALDQFLREIAAQGVLVSAHPDAILKIGTKDVLVQTKSIGWSADVSSYRSVDEFRARFPASVRSGTARVLKQHRGNGGQGVWKVTPTNDGRFLVQSATRGAAAETMTGPELEEYFGRHVFAPGSHLIDQAWIPTMTRGMVRAYLCGTKVAGFGFQEINALHPAGPGENRPPLPPSPRHYYTGDCGLFQPLRRRLESEWVPALAAQVGLAGRDFPLLWDADFFFADRPQDYVLCEINASCVSPFPESAVGPIVRELTHRLGSRG